MYIIQYIVIFLQKTSTSLQAQKVDPYHYNNNGNDVKKPLLLSRIFYNIDYFCRLSYQNMKKLHFNSTTLKLFQYECKNLYKINLGKVLKCKLILL